MATLRSTPSRKSAQAEEKEKLHFPERIRQQAAKHLDVMDDSCQRVMSTIRIVAYGTTGDNGSEYPSEDLAWVIDSALTDLGEAKAALDALNELLRPNATN
jgi:hypothetical protein